MAAKFLTGNSLSKKIRQVMADKKPRMCVAFLGGNWMGEIFEGPPPADLKVVCDIGMGMTARAALTAWGAPSNRRLRHLGGIEMHAKVYLSRSGAVVCSANASRSALSADNRIEDGVWIAPETEAYKDVKKIFKERFKKADPVDEKALAAAPEHVPWVPGRSKVADGQTLVALLRQNPDVFRGMRFVFTSTKVAKSVRAAADDRLEENVEKSEDVPAPAGRRYFFDWEIKEEDWPALFFNVHLGSQGGFYLEKNRHHRFLRDVEGHEVFVSHTPGWAADGAAFGDLPKLASQERCKAELKELLCGAGVFENFTGEILTGEEFAERLFRAKSPLNDG